MISFLLLFVGCGAQAAHQHGAEELAGPAANPTQIGPGPDQHFLANTLSTLRSSSNSVGDVVREVLNVESGLVEVHKNLAMEYTAWHSKKDAYVAERAQLQAMVGKLQAALDEQHKAQVEKFRLQQKLSEIKSATNEIMLERQAEETKAKSLQQKFEIEIKFLEQQSPKDQDQGLLKLAEENNRTVSLQQEKLDLEKSVLTLSRKIERMQETSTQHETRTAEDRAATLKEIQEYEQKVRQLQAKVVMQAQLRQEVLTSQMRVAAQATEVAKQRKYMMMLEANCTADLTSVDSYIQQTTAALRTEAATMTQCQQLDARNQEIQRRLNACKIQRQR